jgi:hypothetical protein
VRTTGNAVDVKALETAVSKYLTIQPIQISLTFKALLNKEATGDGVEQSLKTQLIDFIQKE